MKEDFKYEIWNLPSYIADLEDRTRSLSESDLEKVSGGIMNRKLAASIFAGLSVFTITPTLLNQTSGAVSPIFTSNSELINQNINFEITKEQAIEDINYVLKVIKDNHVSSVEKVPDEVTNQAKIEIENLENKVSVIDEWRSISRIFSKLHDAHTKVLPPKFLNNRVPFDTEYKDGKFICINEEFKNCEIVSINDVLVSDLYRIFQNHYSYEIGEWTEHHFFETPSYFISEWKLALCGIDTSKPIKVSFKTEAGIQSQNFEVSKIEVPNREKEHWVSYEIDEKNSLGIFKLNECHFNSEYIQILGSFFKEISDKKIKNIAIDLRKNVGGDGSVVIFALGLKKFIKAQFGRYDIRTGDEILKVNSQVFSKDDIEKFRAEYLGKNYNKSGLFDGEVFILTSHRTFSSAMLFATMFSDNNLGTIVGEIPGNSPESFGQVLDDVFRTRSSKLRFTITSRKLYRPDETKDGTRLIPDVQVPAKDALNKVYEIIKNK